MNAINNTLSLVTCTLLLLLSITTALAQANATLKTRYGKISEQEWALTSVPYAPEAEKVVLKASGQLDLTRRDDARATHIRIKVLKEGTAPNNVLSFTYNPLENKERVMQVKAHTYNKKANGKEESTKVPKENIVTQELNPTTSRVNITFPDVKVGSIIELRYELATRGNLYLDNWAFQHKYPTLFSEFLLIQNEESLEFKTILNGRQLTKKYGYGAKEEYWSLENLPALVNVPFLVNTNKYTENIGFQLVKFIEVNDLGYAASILPEVNYREKTIGNDWKSLLEDMFDSDLFRSYLNRKGLAKKVLEKEVNLLSNKPMVKAQKIYQWVQSNFTWNESTGIYPEKFFGEALKANYHSNAVKTFLLIALLKGAGFEAHPAYLSTVKNGIVDMGTPQLSQFDYVVCFVKIGQSQILLDPTLTSLPFGYLAPMALTDKVAIYNGEEVKWIRLPVQPNNTKNVSIDLKLTEPQGTANINYAGYESIALRQQYAETVELPTYKQLQFEVANMAFEPQKPEQDFALNSTAPISITVPLKTAQTLSPQTDKLEVNAFLYRFIESNPFEADSRTLPIETLFPFMHKYNLTLTIPENYQVATLPKAQTYTAANQKVSFSFTAQEKEGQVEISAVMIHQSTSIAPTFYEELKAFYEKVLTAQQGIVVLQKAQYAGK